MQQRVDRLPVCCKRNSVSGSSLSSKSVMTGDADGELLAIAAYTENHGIGLRIGLREGKRGGLGRRRLAPIPPCPCKQWRRRFRRPRARAAGIPAAQAAIRPGYS